MKNLVMGVLFTGLVIAFGACGGGSNKPDASTIDAALSCNPLDQTGCEPGEKCTWVIDQDNPRVGHIDCAPDGTVAAQGACTYGPAGPMGYDNCVAGTACNSGECKVICDQNEMSPLCPANYSCGLYENFFDQGAQTVAGVCDAHCDPLNQNTLATNEVACGSTDPANPNKGCYTSNGFRQFTCAPANNSPDMNVGVLHRTDDQPPRTNSAGRPYPNGCAPGYQAIFNEGPTMMVAKCTGLCAPRDTDMVKSGGDPRYGAGDPAASAKLVLEPAPLPNQSNATCKGGKKGSQQAGKQDGSTQNCLHMWQFLTNMGMTTDNQYNDTLGACFNFSEWRWDDDMNPATETVPVPNCSTVAMATKRTDPAARLGCYSLATYTTLAPARDEDPTELNGRIRAPQARRDVRVQYLEAPLVRHSYY